MTLVPEPSLTLGLLPPIHELGDVINQRPLIFQFVYNRDS